MLSFKTLQVFVTNNIEPLIWAAVLFCIFFMDVSGGSICIFKMIGFNSCPGCGIGHSIHDVLHFNFTTSIKEHVFGIPVTTIILWQTVKPFFRNKTQHNYHGSANAYDAKGNATR